jgi:hypothetical protein
VPPLALPGGSPGPPKIDLAPVKYGGISLGKELIKVYNIKATKWRILDERAQLRRVSS